MYAPKALLSRIINTQDLVFSKSYLLHGATVVTEVTQIKVGSKEQRWQKKVTSMSLA